MIKKYLVGDKAGKLYTVTTTTDPETEEETKELTEIEGYLSASLFTTYGVDEIPTSDLLITLVNPSVYCWKDSGTPKLKAATTALPYPQVVYSRDFDMSDKTIIGVESVEIDGDDNTLYAVSVDGGTTWWNYVNYTWVQLSANTSGQTRDAIEEISTTAWAEFATTGTIRFRFVLAAASNYVNEVRINYLNTAHGEPTQKILQGITVKTPPNKQIYTVGENLDLTGISVIATYDNDTKAAVTNGCRYSMNDGDPLVTVGQQNITVRYTESGVTKTTVFEINVLAA